MAQKTVEGRRAGQRMRPSKDVARSTDTFHIAHLDLAVHRISGRLGVSIEVAAVLAQLAGLGPREARP